jgi:hypothetical protein
MDAEVGVVDLVDVAGEDNLGAFAGPGDNGLDLVRGQVLGLVDDHEHLHQAAAADVGQRFDGQLVAVEQASAGAGTSRSFPETGR